MIEHREDPQAPIVESDRATNKQELDDIAAPLEAKIAQDGNVRLLDEVRGLGAIETTVMRKLFMVTTMSMVMALAGCGGGASTSSRQLANPASENCMAQGGRLVIETAGDGGQYGVCLFEDNRQCEEWALLRGACPAGGLKVTGYVTPEARYCAIRGGDYAVTREPTATTPEQGTCTLPGEPTCDALALYEGRCP